MLTEEEYGLHVCVLVSSTDSYGTLHLHALFYMEPRMLTIRRRTLKSQLQTAICCLLFELQMTKVDQFNFSLVSDGFFGIRNLQ